ncbi:MAG: 30S ribosomal protein S11 [Candidatus Saccharimonadales bacterium]
MAEQMTTTAPVATEAPAAAPAVKKKKSKRSVPQGQVHVFATFNNTIITVTDSKGGVLVACSAGACGFRGSKKGTAYAAQVAAEKAVAGAKQAHGLSKVDVFIKGVGLGRDAAVRVLAAQSVQVESIHDITSIAHGGVRPRKARRV